jgi:3-phosphoshikimate 1-carboxyvinyltransferase
MRPFVVKPASHLEGEITLSGDKSIAHRSIIISAITPGRTVIENFPVNKDCLSTIKAFRKLGIKITQGRWNRCKASLVVAVSGKGLLGLQRPKSPIFIGESGTTLRLILGVLAGQSFQVRLLAGESLSQRPMRRVTVPLRLMGANIISNIKYQKSKIEEYPPITIRGGSLKAITYRMPVASAQLKSAILLAALYAKGTIKVIEPVKTRDHTEHMLRLFGADIKVKHPPSLKLRRVVLRSSKSAGGHPPSLKLRRVVLRSSKSSGGHPPSLKLRRVVLRSSESAEGQNTIVIKNNHKELVSPKKVYIPGDISSASFFIVMAVILPKAQVLIRNVSLNPARIGIIKVLKRMGANINIKYQKSILRLHSGLMVSRVEPSNIKYGEPIGDLVVRSSQLKGVTVKKEEIPSLIDELPVLMVAACLAKGRTVFEGVEELRVKETDRIKSMSVNLKKMGADIKVLRVGKSEKIVIQGVRELRGSQVKSFGDHRTAMSMVVAGLGAVGRTEIDDISCISKSFPDFTSLLKPLIQ